MQIRHLIAIGAAVTLAPLRLTLRLRRPIPLKAIKFVVPFPARSATDVVDRINSPRAMGKELGQPIVVDNKSGAQGTVGANEVKGAAADGIYCWSPPMAPRRQRSNEPAQSCHYPAKISTNQQDRHHAVRVDHQRQGTATDLKSFIATSGQPGKVRFGPGFVGVVGIGFAIRVDDQRRHADDPLQGHFAGDHRHAGRQHRSGLCRPRQCKAQSGAAK